MTHSELVSAAIALLIVIYLIVRQFQERSVSWKSLRFPVLAAVVCGVLFVYSNPALDGYVAVAGGAMFGLLTGVLGAQFVRLWRGQDGVVYQKGDWRYLLILLAFIALRIVARVALGHVLSQTVMDGALIAAIIGNYLGRAATVLMRVAPLSPFLPSR